MLYHKSGRHSALKITVISIVDVLDDVQMVTKNCRDLS